jgi:hypothetical protein
MRLHTRVLIASAAALTVLGLSGCGDVAPASAPQATATVTEQAPAPVESSEDLFWAAVSGESSFALAAGRQSTVKLGTGICVALDGGAGAKEIVTAGLQSGVPPEAIAAVLAGSVVFLCPEHQDRVTAELNALSGEDA